METHDLSSHYEERTTIEMDLFYDIMQEPPDVNMIPEMHPCSLLGLEDCKSQASGGKQSTNLLSRVCQESPESSDASGNSSEASIFIANHELASDIQWGSNDHISTGFVEDAKHDLNVVSKSRHSPQIFGDYISSGFGENSKHDLNVILKGEHFPKVLHEHISSELGDDSKHDLNLIFNNDQLSLVSNNHISPGFGEDSNYFKALKSKHTMTKESPHVCGDHISPCFEEDSKHESKSDLSLARELQWVSSHRISSRPGEDSKYDAKVLNGELAPARKFQWGSDDHISPVFQEDAEHELKISKGNHATHDLDHGFAKAKQLHAYESPKDVFLANEDCSTRAPEDSKSNASSPITDPFQKVGEGLSSGMVLNFLDLNHECENIRHDLAYTDLDFNHEYENIKHHDESFVADEDGCIQVPEDSKSNASSTTTEALQLVNEDLARGNVPVVDLISDSDSDSDCEEEFTHSQGRSHGKRTLPAFMDAYAKPSKALCMRDAAKDGFNQLNSLNSFCMHPNSSMRAVKTEPRLDRPYEGTNPSSNKIAMPMQSVCSNSGATSNIFPTVALQNGGLTSNNLPSSFLSHAILPKDHLADNSSNKFLQALDGRTLKDEPYPDDGVLTVPLLKHQRIAVAWMEKRERGTDCAGGILADDQGLGKTVSTIALILKAKPPAPSNSLGQSKQLCNEAFTVDLDDDDDDSSCINQSEWKSTSETKFIDPSTSGIKGRPAAGTLVVCPTSVLRQWAQELKEKVVDDLLSVHIYHGNNRVKNLHELAKHDVVLTTYSIVSLEVPKIPLPEEKEVADDRNPTQYGLIGEKTLPPSRKKVKGKGRKGDLDAYDDTRGGPLAKVAWFRVVLDEAQSIKNRRTQAARACWGLRAKRRWCLSGTPIQNTIDDLYSYFRFLRHEKYGIYKSFRYEIKDPISRNPSSGYQKLQSVLQTILLRRTKATQIDGEPIINLPKKKVKLEQVDFTPEERDFYTNLEVQSRKQFQMYAAAGTVQSNYVNILWMLLRLRQACDHPRLVKGDFSDTVESASRDFAGKLSEEKRASLLSVLERNCDTCGICSDAPEDAVITPCYHVFCRQCIYDRVSNDDNASCPDTKCQAALTVSTLFSYTDLKESSERLREPSFDTSSQPCLRNIEVSSKIRAVINTLRALPVFETAISSADQLDGFGSLVKRTEKAIVFSQWTSMLDLLEHALKNEGFSYRRLDGTMSIQARDRALYDFKQSPDVTVIIMSLKAASLGLNMVTASHVLLIDVWWNPTTEDQAIDRAHRIGQTRDVHVSRFTVKNTIEDRILALQDKKRQMVASAFGEDSSTEQKSRLTVDEMSFLFRA